MSRHMTAEEAERELLDAAVRADRLGMIMSARDLRYAAAAFRRVSLAEAGRFVDILGDRPPLF